jgi:hypothetical protein
MVHARGTFDRVLSFACLSQQLPARCSLHMRLLADPGRKACYLCSINNGGGAAQRTGSERATCCVAGVSDLDVADLFCCTTPNLMSNESNLNKARYLPIKRPAVALIDRRGSVDTVPMAS